MSFKLVVVLSTVMALSGCKGSLDSVNKGRAIKGVDTIDLVCLNGVSYYVYIKGYRGAMAVKIDKDTLQPVLCEESIL
jgi:hypothetical protein